MEDSRDCTCDTWELCESILGHNCICLTHSAKRCRSGDLHQCICPVLYGDETMVPIISSDQAKSEAEIACRSITGHYCVCYTSYFSTCLAQDGYHEHCICRTQGSSQCRVSSKHECSCSSAATGLQPKDCRALNTEHHCICLSSLICRSSYGRHQCLCPYGLHERCKARVH